MALKGFRAPASIYIKLVEPSCQDLGDPPRTWRPGLWHLEGIIHARLEHPLILEGPIIRAKVRSIPAFAGMTISLQASDNVFLEEMGKMGGGAVLTVVRQLR
jgi:hypothetical protein